MVNLSVNQTLSRTVITAGTTLLSVLSLYLFGGEALRGFAFTMLVGIVSGTYSTVFIASAIATQAERDNAPRGQSPSSRKSADPMKSECQAGLTYCAANSIASRSLSMQKYS